MIVKNCESCRFWSELISRLIPGVPLHMEALCLNAMSENYERWTRTTDVCAKQQIGEPVDLKGRAARC